MTLSELIQEMKSKGLMSVAPIRFIGKAKPTFEMLTIMADTLPEETDPNYWGIRLYMRRN